ncbi:hypothetical protein GCM10010203_53240 [Actinomadura yumaensis]|jgi:hypothetical protein|nr:hypothetical protein [Brevundimonas sp.]HAF80620.1 hypothetical protein [Brevundimonas sp.]
MLKRGRSLAGLVASLLITSSLGGCLTLAAYQRLHEEQAADRFRQPGAAELTWFQAQGFPLSGMLQMTARLTRPLPTGMGFGPKETLTCEGKAIRLIPDTPRNRWLIANRMWLPLQEEGVWRNGSPTEWRWPEPTGLIREATCGAGGAFRFEGVPDGGYLVMAQISPPAYAADDFGEGFDIVLKSVRVSGGQSRAQLNIRLSDDDWLSPVVRQR